MNFLQLLKKSKGLETSRRFLNTPEGCSQQLAAADEAFLEAGLALQAAWKRFGGYSNTNAQVMRFSSLLSSTMNELAKEKTPHIKCSMIVYRFAHYLPHT